MAERPPAPESSGAHARGSGPPPEGGLLARLVTGKILFWVLVAIFVAADLWTKDVIIAEVRREASAFVGGSQGFVLWLARPWLGLVDVSNTGGPFGVFAGSVVLRVVRFLALGVILYLLAATPRTARVQVAALAMIMGGALGNIWDTLRYGSVRDFLYVDLGFKPFDPWPAFNLADSLICVGVALLAFMLYHDWAAERRRRGAASGEGDGAEGDAAGRARRGDLRKGP